MYIVVHPFSVTAYPNRVAGTGASQVISSSRGHIETNNLSRPYSNLQLFKGTN